MGGCEVRLFKRKINCFDDNVSEKIHKDEVETANESARNIKGIYIKLPYQKEVKIF